MLLGNSPTANMRTTDNVGVCGANSHGRYKSCTLPTHTHFIPWNQSDVLDRACDVIYFHRLMTLVRSSQSCRQKRPEVDLLNMKACANMAVWAELKCTVWTLVSFGLWTLVYLSELRSVLLLFFLCVFFLVFGHGDLFDSQFSLNLSRVKNSQAGHKLHVCNIHKHDCMQCCISMLKTNACLF